MFVLRFTKYMDTQDSFSYFSSLSNFNEFDGENLR